MLGFKTKGKSPGVITLPSSVPPSRIRFDLDQRLLSFSPKDHFSLRSAVTGTFVMGGTGSGKTSGSGRAIALSFLRGGYGGIVLCAKPGERALWERYAKETGREKSLIVFGADGSRRFNFLDYELRRGDRLVTQNLVALFLRIMEAAKGRERGGMDSFWKDAVSELLSNAFLVLYSAWGHVTMADLMSLIATTARNDAQGEDEKWRERSFCYQSLLKMFKDPANPLPKEDAIVAGNFFRQRWPNAADKMRSGIEFTLSSLASPFLTGYLRELFCTTTNTLPEFTHEGAILVIDLPIKEHGEAGVLAQHVWKYLWQRAAERRGEAPNTRPIFLWADECQFFMSEYDNEFQSTARSSKACTVYMTQSLPALFERMGHQSKDAVYALLNNFQTRIFHQNLCPITNEYASDVISEVWMNIVTHGSNHSTSTSNSIGSTRSNGGGYSSSLNGPGTSSSNWSYGTSRSTSRSTTHGTSESVTPQIHRQVLPSAFSSLRQGGRGGAPQAIVVESGRTFRHSGKPFLTCEFPQG